MYRFSVIIKAIYLNNNHKRQAWLAEYTANSMQSFHAPVDYTTIWRFAIGGSVNVRRFIVYSLQKYMGYFHLSRIINLFRLGPNDGPCI